MKAPGKKVAVLGLGISGFQSALFLKERGFEVWVSDQGNSETLKERAEKLRQKEIEVECGKHSEARILESDWVLISPGIAPSSPVYQAVCGKRIPIYSEIEAASWFSSSDNIIAVTGTSGKTTVTTLITRVLQKAGFCAVSCGNIGNPWIGEISRIKKDHFAVLEVSSFQLQHCSSFRPKAGVLLNLSANHEDWHKDIAEYTAAKLKIFENQTSKDYAVFRKQDQARFFPGFKFQGQTAFFGGGSGNPNEEAVRLVTGFFGATAEQVEEVLAAFEGIEHRLEKFLTANGITYINDSKCTTTASLAWALEKFPDGKIILLAGGHPKSRDFQNVRDLLRKKAKAAILIGEAKPILREAWEGACPLIESEDFKHAVEAAHEKARPGDIVLLSPACASFDLFKNYIERGTFFKKIARELTGNSLSHV